MLCNLPEVAELGLDTGYEQVMSDSATDSSCFPVRTKRKKILSGKIACVSVWEMGTDENDVSHTQLISMACVRSYKVWMSHTN